MHLQPLSAIRRMARWISYDSGVVLFVLMISSPITIPRVPMVPVLIPPFSNMKRIMQAVVVLPLVPVRAMVFSAFAGCPKYAADMYARATRVSSVLITATDSGRGISSLKTIAAAPFFAASAAYLCPSVSKPLRQTNAQPGTAFLESYTTSEMSGSPVPCIRTDWISSSNRLSFIVVPPKKF